MLVLRSGPPALAVPLAMPLDRLGQVRADRRDGAERHVILADRDGDHRILLRGPSPLLATVAYIPLDADLPFRAHALARFHRRLLGQPTGPPARPLRLTAMRRDRLIQLLEALDYRVDGASPRDIAAELLDRDAADLRAIEWKSSALRRRTMRLIEDGQALMRGGYRALLRGA